MEDYTFTTMLLKCIAEQDEKITAQEKLIAELQHEIEEILDTCQVAKTLAAESGD